MHKFISATLVLCNTVVFNFISQPVDSSTPYYIFSAIAAKKGLFSDDFCRENERLSRPKSNKNSPICWENLDSRSARVYNTPTVSTLHSSTAFKNGAPVMIACSYIRHSLHLDLQTNNICMKYFTIYLFIHESTGYTYTCTK